jgi:hypothetical protein
MTSAISRQKGANRSSAEKGAHVRPDVIERQSNQLCLITQSEYITAGPEGVDAYPSSAILPRLKDLNLPSRMLRAPNKSWIEWTHHHQTPVGDLDGVDLSLHLQTFRPEINMQIDYVAADP